MTETERIGGFGSIAALFGRIAVTDATAAALSPEEGVSRAVAMLRDAAARGGCVYFIGNGASQSISSHMSADLTKNGRIRALAFTDPSLLTCIGNDLGYERVFAEPLARVARSGDVLVAISSSGSSPNILAAVSVARAAGCGIVTLSGFAPDNPLRGGGDVNFHVPSHDYGEVEVVHHGICHRIADEVAAGGPA